MRTEGSDRIGVIGGGLGGLAAACTLAARGARVTLFERNDEPGGKAQELRAEGFRFDMGPTILTLPSVLRRVFAEAGRRLEDYLDLVRLDPQWRCFFSDRSTLDLTQDPGGMAARLEAFTGRPDSGERYLKFMQWSERLHETSRRHFFYRSVGGLGDLVNVGALVKRKLWGDLVSLRMGRTVAGMVRAFAADGRVAQMMDHFTQYVGSSPYNSPAVLCGIAHMQTGEGVWYPVGGTRAVPMALCRLAGELGVEIRCRTAISRIVTEGERVVGVRTADGEEIALQAVISNSDAVLTHRELLPESVRVRFEARRRYEPACSGVVLYLGLRRRYDHLAHHNFVFSRDPEEEFKWIYRQGEPAPDPTCYLAATASTDPDAAPPGGEALYVLVHTPYLRPHHDWSRLLPGYRRAIFEKLKTTGQMPDLEDRLAFQRVLTPADIRDRYHVLAGAIYGLASHGRFVGAFKPANRSSDLRGLYLCGGSAHPGPGMPMVVMSGWIAADALCRDGLGGAVPKRWVPLVDETAAVPA